MKYELSLHAARRIRERKIKTVWIEMALTYPDHAVADTLDSTVRHALKRIAEADDRILRVVYNWRNEPIRVISAYFDRRLKGAL